MELVDQGTREISCERAGELSCVEPTPNAHPTANYESARC